MQFTPRYKITVTFSALAIFALLGPAPATAQYVVGTPTILQPASGYGNTIGRANIPGTQYGYGVNSSTGNNDALMWNSSAGSVTDLSPTNTTSGSATYNASLIYAQAGGQEGGIGEVAATSSINAILWNGSNTNVTNLNPTGFTSSSIEGMAANGTASGIQVGQGDIDGNTNALVWYGSANNYLDLNGALTFSEANAVNSNNVVVGVAFGGVTGTLNHAYVWNVTPGSQNFTTTDLNPLPANGVDFDYTEADAISGNLVAGFGVNTAINTNNRAMLWNISNQGNVTWTDLSTVLGSNYTASQASGIYGDGVVGFATTTATVNGVLQQVNHAIWWAQSGQKVLDLNAALPLDPEGTQYANSYAYGITADGTIVGVAQYTYNGNSYENAVLWKVAIPAPPALPVMASGLTLIGGILVRRRRKA